MDPRRLLGVDPTARPEEVRAAHASLVALTDPGRSGAPGLRRLVDRACSAALDGGGALDIDPHDALGVAPGASRHEVREAYRRVAAAVHPDRGGTDGLFVIVHSAYRVLVDPRARRRISGAWWQQRPAPAPSPPPRPPPPRPWTPPPSRRPPSRRQAGWALARYGGALLALAGAGTVAVLAALAQGSGAGVVAAVAASGTVLVASQPLAVGMLRAAAGLRGVRSDGSVRADPARFLAACCLGGMVVREQEENLWSAYLAWCGSQGERPLPPWTFAEHLRSLGLVLVKEPWERGIWIGVELRSRREGRRT